MEKAIHGGGSSVVHLDIWCLQQCTSVNRISKHVDNGLRYDHIVFGAFTSVVCNADLQMRLELLRGKLEILFTDVCCCRNQISRCYCQRHPLPFPNPPPFQLPGPYLPLARTDNFDSFHRADNFGNVPESCQYSGSECRRRRIAQLLKDRSC